MFSLYANKLFKIVESHLPNPRCNADDTQLFIAFTPGNDLEETSAITATESCIAGISQCLLTGMRQQIQKVSDISTILVGDSQIVPSYPLSITFITRVELGNICHSVT